MAFRMLGLAGGALIAAALLMPATAGARNRPPAPQPYAGEVYAFAADPPRDRDGYPRTGSRRDGYSRDYSDESRQPPRRAAYRERRDSCERGTAGALLGAIAGGLLGDSGAARSSRPTNTRGAPISDAARRDCD